MPDHIGPTARMNGSTDEHSSDGIEQVGEAGQRREHAQIGRPDHTPDRACRPGDDEAKRDVFADLDTGDQRCVFLQADGMDAPADDRPFKHNEIGDQHHRGDDDFRRDAEDIADRKVSIFSRCAAMRDRSAAIGEDALDRTADEECTKRGEDGLTESLTTRKALSRPTRAPPKMPRSTARYQTTSYSFMATMAKAAPMSKAMPTDKSMPPMATTSVMPSARISRIDEPFDDVDQVGPVDEGARIKCEERKEGRDDDEESVAYENLSHR